MNERIDDQMEDLKGRVKEGLGAATDDKDLEREGKIDRASAGAKKAAHKAADAASDAVDAAKDAVEDLTHRDSDRR